MSQSTSAYGVRTSKDSARKRRERQNSNPDGEPTETQAEPACPSRAVGHSVDKRDWREVAYDERRLVSYRACQWPACYPDGPPDASETETVVRSSHRPTVYHRPRECGNDDCDSAARAQAGGEHEAVGAITDLREGERVVWEGQQWSMHVAESATKPDGVVRLSGTNGGIYRIEGRPDSPQTVAIYPGVGIVSDLCRVVPADDHPRSEPV